MNDFFTELASDLLSVKNSILPPKPPVIEKKTESVSYIPKKEPVVVPIQKKYEPTTDKSIGNKPTTPPPNHVDEIRSQMMKGGTVVIVFKADEKTRTLLGHLRLETRGFAYLEEVREAHKIVIKRARASYEDTMRDVPDIEEKDLIKIIRKDLEIFLQNKMNRTPVIIPMIIYI